MALKRFLFFTLLIVFPLQASFEARLPGTRYMALGLSGRAAATSFSLFANPAAIALSERARIDLFYRTYWGVEGLNGLAVQGSFKALGLNHAVALNRFGNPLYSENDIAWGTAYGWLDGQLQTGVALHFYQLSIERYGSAGALSFSVALQYRPVESITIAAVADNILRPELGQSGEQVPLQGALAFSYAAASGIVLNVDVFKDELYDFTYHIGLAVEVLEQFDLLAGVRDQDVFSAGAAYKNGAFVLDYALELHPILNISHGLGFQYAF